MEIQAEKSWNYFCCVTSQNMN